MLQQNPNAPAAALPHIVLPDFTRSWSADGDNIINAITLNKTQTKAGKGLTEKRAREYGGNDGLAFAMCAARKRRKEPAGAG